MFWADKKLEEVKETLADTIKGGEPLVIRDEKTASGRIHVGSMRGVAIHGILSEVLSEAGIGNIYKYELNDFDPMDGMPANLDADAYRAYMGKPLCTIPPPDSSGKPDESADISFTEHYGREFLDVIEETGFYPEIYRASDLYKSGRMNDVIKTALERADAIRDIYRRVSGSQKGENWFPLSVVCERCGKIGTTKAISFDGETVAYTCEPYLVDWAEGCGHHGRISPFNGNAKLPWKVEWAAKFKVIGVSIEGGGKDHSTRGGARDVANHIAKEVFDTRPPVDVPYEFFLVGGKKMSASKGSGSSAREIADLIPPEIFRLALIGKDPMRAFDFEPAGDTIPTLFDLHDKLAEKYFGEVDDDEARLFTLIYPPDEREDLSNHFRPRFSQIAFLIQMPHMDFLEEVTRMKGSALSETEIQEANYRAEYARKWIDAYAPEAYRYELQTDSVPEATQTFSDLQKKALEELLRYIERNEKLDGQELHTTLHDIRKDVGIEPKDFFKALYLSFLGKESGPKAGWFLSVLDRDFLISRLKTVSA